MMSTVLTRLSQAFLTVPSLHDWLIALAIFLLYSAIAFSVGWYGGFLRPNSSAENGWAIVKGVVITLVSPVLLEELIFRVLLIPPLSEGLPLIEWATWAGISLLLFMVYHPLKVPGLFKAGRSPLNEPIFPVLTGLLGIACTATYILTGSIWTVVAFHWVMMAVWLFGLGGIAKLSQPSS